MIMRSAEDSVPESNDLDDIRGRYLSLREKADTLTPRPTEEAP